MGCCFALFGFLAGPAGAGGSPTIVVQPVDGAPVGAEVVVEGSGFLPGESVTVSYVGLTFGPVFADDFGSVRVVFTMPDAPLGEHPLDATGDAGSIAGVDYPVVESPTTEAANPAPQPVAPGGPDATGAPDDGVVSTTGGATEIPGADPGSDDPPTTSSEESAGEPAGTSSDDRDGDDGGDGGTPGWLVPGLLVVLVVGIATVATIRFFPAPRPRAVPGPCHDLAEKLERLRRWRDRLRDQQAPWEKDAADRRAKADRFREGNQRAIEAEKAAAASATSGSTPKAWESERLDEEARQAEEMRDQGAAALRSADERIKQLEKELEECIKNPPVSSTPAGTAQQQEDAGCCAAGTWAGLVVVNGGVVGAGASGGFVFLWCVGDTNRDAKLRFTGMRLGPAIGGEFAAVSLIGITGVRHPRDLAPAVSDVLDGFDWDLSVGAPLGRIARTGRSVGDRGFWKALIDHLSDVGREVPSKLSRGDMSAAKEVMKEGLAKAGGKSATNELESLSRGEPGATFSLPLAVGLQAGFWHLEIVQMDVVSYDGCAVCGSESVRVRGF